jgi:hypothetical protein
MYGIYLGLQAAGIVRLTQQRAEPQNVFQQLENKANDIVGTLTVRLGENGSRYVCKAEDRAQSAVPARARSLCLPYLPASVDRVVPD